MQNKPSTAEIATEILVQAHQYASLPRTIKVKATNVNTEPILSELQKEGYCSYYQDRNFLTTKLTYKGMRVVTKARARDRDAILREFASRDHRYITIADCEYYAEATGKGMAYIQNTLNY